MLTPVGVGGRPRSPGRRGRGAWLPRLLLVALLLAAVAAGTWWWYLGSSEPEVAARPTPSCPAPSPTPTVLPPSEVTVNVYNATDRRGLAARVARQLRQRGFAVRRVDNDPTGRTVTGLAEVRSGPGGEDAARTVIAHVGGGVGVPDQRDRRRVDLALGPEFRRLEPTAAAAEALRPTPQPRPTGCR
jgi:hypothetical protein